LKLEFCVSKSLTLDCIQSHANDVHIVIVIDDDDDDDINGWYKYHIVFTG
jgi:hypothetical protein